MRLQAGTQIAIDYTNWRGERAQREIVPTGVVEFTSNEWHPEPQWLVSALDVKSGIVKQFALNSIHT